MRGRAVVLLLLAAAVPACAEDDGDDGRLDVAAAMYPLAELAARVGGDHIAVTNLTPPGVEPHDLELSSDDLDDIDRADLLLYVGQGFQPAVEEVAGRAGTSIDLLEDVDGDDPHVWLDPTQMVALTEQVRDALIDLDGDRADDYRANAASYRDELERLDGELEAGLTGCARDTIVTSHAAFGFLAARYGLRQEAISGLSPDAEPDPDRLGELADEVRAAGVTTIFYETLVSPDVAETLAREAGVDTAVLNPIEGLSGDELDAGATYASVMRDNLAALRRALGCP